MTVTTESSPIVFTSIVPRQYVHRAAVSEVLLTSWHPTAAPHTFVVDAQWPRGHSLFAQSNGYQDSMLLVESVRQVGSLLAHAEFEVAFGHQFLMRSISFAATRELFAATPAPTEVELHTVCRDIVRRGKNLAGMHYEVTAKVNGVALATAGAAFNCTGPTVYKRLRGERPMQTRLLPGPAIDPRRVGRTDPQHVVLSEDTVGRGNIWELRVDTSHPIFFDHPVDHVPGMVLLEAARQAAHAATGLADALVLDLDSYFERYAELDARCDIEAIPAGVDAGGDALVDVRGIQFDRTVFTARLALRPRIR
ncbi:gamma-butyrolactone biosynthesis enzyme [Streptomyces sp. MUSC 14]|uniref:ScbA/BarX family gamma-butyrolactone biosynthesis protein n=1 Tax=Streptomyces sp. MUSC 14 TaxID=1354889 RepID=UPI0008F5A47A|nr:ScbA/BarX family gamma-butyrolactone biosynthesis protein [Streptomyces sp. MUSC 14]OIJ94465.1 gamma-butyrolactone biosynthesis enzyme [Streptomyces sp. MUSC 14]